jgi:bifunctional UDP-N-acetylglucosamine pyrophosphorylase/glucosamine-1-phosphate N-acetyltransferase
VDLAELSAVLRQRKCRELMLGGVTLEDPGSTYIDADVTVGEDTTIAPGVRLTGRTIIGQRCHVHSGTRISDSTLGDDVTVLDGCIVEQSTVGSLVSLGPFARLRPLSEVGDGAHIGNFVELKKTRFGARSKAGHLAYLGDALVGTDVNIGAGVITVNYDGVNKHQTVIEDGVFVGSDSQLMAPVKLGHGSFIAAGSSITEDVPPDALAVARSHQTTKPEWAAARRSARRNKA